MIISFEYNNLFYLVLFDKWFLYKYYFKYKDIKGFFFFFLNVIVEFMVIGLE